MKVIRIATGIVTTGITALGKCHKKIKMMMSYPMSSGRNFDEILRVLDSLQLSAKHNVATPVNWKPGDDVIIPTSVSEEHAKQKYPGGWKTLKPYLRVVAQPR